MKNLIIIAFTCFLSFSAFAQNQAIETFYNKYMDMEDITDISLEGWLLNMVATYASETDEKVDLTKKISKLRIMIMDEKNIVQKNDKKSLMSGLRSGQFEELFQIRDGKTKIDFMIREEGETITNFIMLVDEVDSFILLSLEGALSLEDLKKLNIEVEGAEDFKKLPRA